MTVGPEPRECPDCGNPLVFAFIDTAGVGAHKRGNHFNTTPDTVHYVCFACAKAWKQRLTGPLSRQTSSANWRCSRARRLTAGAR